MIVLVCGGRHFRDVPLLWRTLDDIHRDQPITLIVEGASDDVTGPYMGADYWAHQWALARGVKPSRHHAQWKVHGGAAGPIRNGEMLKEHKVDIVVSFEGGRGTANMVQQAAHRRVPVIQAARSQPS